MKAVKQPQLYHAFVMRDQIEQVFYDVVKYLLGIGEISGENLFIDGTKIEANADRYSEAVVLL